MIKYIGSKRKLVDTILRAICAFPRIRTVLDLFSGTARVGHALKKRGYRVLANDHNAYAEVLARCYVQADREGVSDDARRLVHEFNRLPGSPGFFTHTYCVQSRFFQPNNGERIDAIRTVIARKGLPPELEAVMLVSLMEAADRVDSTTGIQMAYLKQWAPRSYKDLELRVPEVLPRARHGKGWAYCLDAARAAAVLDPDLVYLDPPYNQHSYLSNYHIWETLIRWDSPDVYGKACKRVDCRQRKSPFNRTRDCAPALEEVIRSLRAPVVVLSFSNEGYLTRDQIEGMLSRERTVVVIENDYKRYVGAQIGIYNPDGDKVGKVGKLRNKEYIYVAASPCASAHLKQLLADRTQQTSLFSAK